MALNFEELNALAGVSNEPDESFIDSLRFDSELEIPMELTDLDVWANYCDDRLYELEKLVRDYFKRTRWKREQAKGQKTAVPLLFLHLFGRQPTAHDSQVCRYLHRILKYYSRSFTGETKINGKRVGRVYYFAPNCYRFKRPLSIRLRIEERGEKNAFIKSPRNSEGKKSESRQGCVRHGVFVDEGRRYDQRGTTSSS